VDARETATGVPERPDDYGGWDRGWFRAARVGGGVNLLALRSHNAALLLDLLRRPGVRG
jgi:hypothetical protein